MFETFFAKLAGKWINNKIKLMEGIVDTSKPWYQSRTIWSSVVSGVIGIYLSLIAGGVHLPSIPAWVITLLSAVGVYSRVTATATIE